MRTSTVTNPTTIVHLHTFNTENVITGIQDTVYYYLPPGCATYADVPIGSRFEMASDSRPERLTFLVTWNKVDKVDKEYCRYYRKITREE